MRISDWSSDVCSSDLVTIPTLRLMHSCRTSSSNCARSTRLNHGCNAPYRAIQFAYEMSRAADRRSPAMLEAAIARTLPAPIGRASCRERGWQYVWISVVAVSEKKNIHINKEDD